MIQEGIRGTGQESIGKGNLSLPGMVPMEINPLNLSLLYQGEGGRDEEGNLFVLFCFSFTGGW